MDVIFSLYEVIDMVASLLLAFWFVLQFLFCCFYPFPRKIDKYFYKWTGIVIISFGLGLFLIDYMQSFSATWTIITTTVVSWVAFHTYPIFLLLANAWTRTLRLPYWAKSHFK